MLISEMWLSLDKVEEWGGHEGCNERHDYKNYKH